MKILGWILLVIGMLMIVLTGFSLFYHYFDPAPKGVSLDVGLTKSQEQAGNLCAEVSMVMFFFVSISLVIGGLTLTRPRPKHLWYLDKRILGWLLLFDGGLFLITTAVFMSVLVPVHGLSEEPGMLLVLLLISAALLVSGGMLAFPKRKNPQNSNAKDFDTSENNE